MKTLGFSFFGVVAGTFQRMAIVVDSEIGTVIRTDLGDTLESIPAIVATDRAVSNAARAFELKTGRRVSRLVIPCKVVGSLKTETLKDLIDRNPYESFSAAQGKKVYRALVKNYSK